MAKVSEWAKAKERPTGGRTSVTRVRLAPSEVEILEQAMTQHGFANRSQYLRYLIFRGSGLPAAPPAGWKAIQELAEALGPIGRNLNQATKALNQGGSVPPDLREIRETVEKLRRHLGGYHMEGVKTLGPSRHD